MIGYKNEKHPTLETNFFYNFKLKNYFKNESNADTFYAEKIDQARGIMDPFILRRLKKDVLKDLPDKIDNIIVCKMTPRQEEEYNKCLDSCKKKRIELNGNNKGLLVALMEFRKAANHPLLRRCLYTDDKIKEMAHIIMRVILL